MSVREQIARHAGRPADASSDEELRAIIERSTSQVRHDPARPQWENWLCISVEMYLREHSIETLRSAWPFLRHRVMAMHGYLGDEAYEQLRRHCIECGCHDDAACWDDATDNPCSWIRMDECAGLGVCSACPQAAARFDAGDRAVAVELEPGQ